MESRTKALVASAVVLALLLTAVSGVTYSWFSDTENAGVDVETGNLSVDMTIKTITEKSQDSKTLGDTDNGTATLAQVKAMPDGFKFGYLGDAKATIDGSVVTVENMAPNDAISVDLDGEIDSTLSYVYRFVQVAKDKVTGEDLSDDFTIKVTGSLATGQGIWNVKKPTDEVKFDNTSVYIKMNKDSTAMDRTAVVGVQIEVYQVNAVLPDDGAVIDRGTVAADDQVTNRIAVADSAVTSVGLSYTAANGATYSITNKDIKSTVEVGETGYGVIAGIELKTDSTCANDFTPTSETVTVLVSCEGADMATDANWTGSDAKFKIVYNDGSDYKAVDLSSATAVTDETAKLKSGQYRIVKDETGGEAYSLEVVVPNLSSYYIVTGAEAQTAVLQEDGSVEYSYGTLADALAAMTDGRTVTMLKDVDATTWTTVEDSDGTFDGNGKTLTVTATGSVFKNPVNLTIEDLSATLSGLSLIDTDGTDGTAAVVKLIDVDVAASAYNASVASYYVNNFYGLSLTMEGCDSNVAFTEASATTAYGVFVGNVDWGGNSNGRTMSLSFTDCSSAGAVTMSKGTVGLYMAAVASVADQNYANMAFSVEGCSVTGALTGAANSSLVGTLDGAGTGLVALLEIAEAGTDGDVTTA